MKMAKKLLAVVLTGVMAVSMLTGCAIGDAIAEDKLLAELKTWGERQSTAVTYEADKSVTVKKSGSEDKKVELNNVAKKVAKQAAKLTDTVANIEAKTATDFTDVDDVVIAIVEKPTTESKRIDAAKKVGGKLSTATAYFTTDSKGKNTIVVYADSFSAKESDKKDAKSHDYIVVVAAKKVD